MSKRSFLFGTLVLLAGLAFATPSRAGSVITTTLSFTAASPGLTEIDFTYTTPGGALVPGSLTPTVLPGSPSVGTATLVGNVVELKFTTPPNPATGDPGPFAFKFQVTDTSSMAASAIPSFTPSGVSLTNFSFSVSSVPEPASLALLGIGMTGLLAFRRFFKKTSVA
jgi:hypothetical protein